MIGLRVKIVSAGAALLAALYGGVSLHATPSWGDYIAAICSTSRVLSAEETRFVADNAKAMTRMMADMEIKPSGDVDSDFVAMMVPHHGGAIEMAQAELRYGHNQKLRRLAQEIIVTQQQEIAAMRLAIGQPLSSAALRDRSPSAERTLLTPVAQQPLY